MYSFVGSHVIEQVDDPLGVTHFVIIPSDEFIKSWIQGNACEFVNDAGVVIASEIRGDELFVCCCENSFELAVGGLFKRIADGLIGGVSRETNREVNR